MGLWKLWKSEPASLIEGSSKAAIRELELRIDSQDAKIRSLETEWAETHLKLRRSLGRLDKHAALERADPQTEFPAEDRPAPLTRDQILKMARRRDH